MILQQNLANILQAIRDTQKVSLTELSEVLNISRSTLQNILNGTCNLRMDTIEQIASRLEVNPALLVSSSFTERQWESILFLFHGIESFSSLPREKKQEAAILLYRLALILSR